MLNELDALVNIDFTTKTVKPNLTSLNIVRVGTSGSLQADIPVGFVVNVCICDWYDNMLRSYDLTKYSKSIHRKSVCKPYQLGSFQRVALCLFLLIMICCKGLNLILFLKELPVTAGGFYGAQGRILRLPLQDAFLNDKNRLVWIWRFKSYQFRNGKLLQFTACRKLLGHKALSLNAIVANRKNGTFSADPYKTIDELIWFALNKIIE